MLMDLVILGNSKSFPVKKYFSYCLKEINTCSVGSVTFIKVQSCVHTPALGSLIVTNRI